MTVQRFSVVRLGQHGDGVAEGPDGPVYLPYALPGEVVTAQPEGDVALVTGWHVVRPDRVAPICSYFGECGGCAVQALPATPYADWKRNLVVAALKQAGIDAPVAPLVDAHGEGRRRATFHARAERAGNVLRAPAARVGFMRVRSHDLINIAHCPVLAPQLEPALPAAHRLADATLSLGKPLDIVATASRAGLDIDLRGLGPLATEWLARLSDVAAELDLARLSNHGVTIIERRTPLLRMGRADVMLPPGTFLQATTAGEAALATLVGEAVGSARRVVDLFSGIGTFALRLAEGAAVHAFDGEGAAIRALGKTARGTPGLKPVVAEARDLFRRPLQGAELGGLDAVVLDPPRAGALAQAETLAQAAVPTVVSVSCNPATFARDAAALLRGGYALERVTPVDQFRYSPHVEVVGVFRRAGPRRRPRPSLFG